METPPIAPVSGPQRNSFTKRLLAAARVRNPENFWSEFGVRMLEIAALVFLVAIVFVWAGLKMDGPTGEQIEPARRNFLASIMLVGSTAMFGFGRSSKRDLPPLATGNDLAQRFIANKTICGSELVDNNSRLVDKRFDNCTIIGPMVIAVGSDQGGPLS